MRARFHLIRSLDPLLLTLALFFGGEEKEKNQAGFLRGCDCRGALSVYLHKYFLPKSHGPHLFVVSVSFCVLVLLRVV